MTRDMELIRKILMALEEHPHGRAPDRLRIEGYDDFEQVYHHMWLLGQAGYVNVTNVTTMGSKSPIAKPIALNWSGHEFLASARNQRVWTKAMEKVRQAGGSISLDVLGQLLKKIALDQLGIE